MIKCGFKYTEGLVKNINDVAVKKYNIIIEIAMLLSFTSLCILFATHNKTLGIIFSGVFVFLLICLIIINKLNANNNKILIGQQVDFKFDENNFIITCTLGDEILYDATFEYSAIKKVKLTKELVLLYFNKKSALPIPKSSFKTVGDYNTIVQIVQNNYIV